MAELIKNVEHAKPFNVADYIVMEKGKANSISLSQTPGTKMTLFAIDEGEGMSTHAASGDAMAFILEGTARITIDDVPHEVSGGEAIILPCGVPHAVLALTPFKMLLTVVKAVGE